MCAWNSIPWLSCFLQDCGSCTLPHRVWHRHDSPGQGRVDPAASGNAEKKKKKSPSSTPQHGADTTTQDNPRCTPLHSAVGNGNVDLTRLFIEHCADTATRDSCRSNPLHSAAKNGGMSLAHLIEHGADATTQENHGLTPLHLAVANGSMDLARLLVDHGADAATQGRLNCFCPVG